MDTVAPALHSIAVKMDRRKVVVVVEVVLGERARESREQRRRDVSLVLFAHWLLAVEPLKKLMILEGLCKLCTSNALLPLLHTTLYGHFCQSDATLLSWSATQPSSFMAAVWMPIHHRGNSAGASPVLVTANLPRLELNTMTGFITA